jgi:hypothetical protein
METDEDLKLSESMKRMLRTTAPEDLAVPGSTRSALMRRRLILRRGPRMGFLTEKGIQVRDALLAEKGWL